MRIKRFYILSLLSILLIGCNVRYSFNGGSVPAEASTFSVDYFNVRASLADPNYGQVITEGLKDLLLDQTPLGLADQDGDIRQAAYLATVRGLRIKRAICQCRGGVAGRN